MLAEPCESIPLLPAHKHAVVSPPACVQACTLGCMYAGVYGVPGDQQHPSLASGARYLGLLLAACAQAHRPPGLFDQHVVALHVAWHPDNACRCITPAARCTACMPGQILEGCRAGVWLYGYRLPTTACGPVPPPHSGRGVSAVCCQQVTNSLVASMRDGHAVHGKAPEVLPSCTWVDGGCDRVWLGSHWWAMATGQVQAYRCVVLAVWRSVAASTYVIQGCWCGATPLSQPGPPAIPQSSFLAAVGAVPGWCMPGDSAGLGWWRPPLWVAWLRRTHTGTHDAHLLPVCCARLCPCGPPAPCCCLLGGAHNRRLVVQKAGVRGVRALGKQVDRSPGPVVLHAIASSVLHGRVCASGVLGGLVVTGGVRRRCTGCVLLPLPEAPAVGLSGGRPLAAGMLVRLTAPVQHAAVLCSAWVRAWHTSVRGDTCTWSQSMCGSVWLVVAGCQLSCVWARLVLACGFAWLLVGQGV